MYIHQQTGTPQNTGSTSHRQRHLCDLMTVCKLGRGLDQDGPHEALLDRLVRNAAEAIPLVFSKIITREVDDSYVCRAIYYGNGLSDAYQKNQATPMAAWPYYSSSFSDHQIIAVRRRDPALTDEERHALGLHIAQCVWMLPLKDGSENIGLLVLGGDYHNGSSLVLKRMDVITSIAEQATLAIQTARQKGYLEISFIKIILALAEAIDATDPDAYNHCRRTANLAVALAVRLGFKEEETNTLRMAGLLHDIGKAEISEEILQKPGPLSPAEWEIIKRHPVTGADILSPVPSLGRVSEIIRAHHEKFDGRGYPYGLRGEQIPFEARILSVADAYSVMINGRIYRAAFTQAEAVAELKRCSGTDFDPRVVEELLELIQQGEID